MLKNKKKLKKAAAFLICFSLFWNLIVGNFAYEIYARLFFLPRLKVTVNLTVDGEPYRIKKDDVQGLPRGSSGNSVSRIAWFVSRKDGCKLREWGGGYGANPFQIRIQTESMQAPKYLPVDCVVCNWYELGKFIADIEVDTAAGTFSYTGSSKEGKAHWDAHQGKGTLRSESDLQYSYYYGDYVYLGGC